MVTRGSLKCFLMAVLLFICRLDQNIAFAITATGRSHMKISKSRNSLQMFDPLISLGASSIAGVIGIGAAYPLDSLKVKTQTYASNPSVNSSNL